MDRLTYLLNFSTTQESRHRGGQWIPTPPQEPVFTGAPSGPHFSDDTGLPSFPPAISDVSGCFGPRTAVGSGRFVKRAGLVRVSGAGKRVRCGFWFRGWWILAESGKCLPFRIRFRTWRTGSIWVPLLFSFDGPFVPTKSDQVRFLNGWIWR